MSAGTKSSGGGIEVDAGSVSQLRIVVSALEQRSYLPPLAKGERGEGEPIHHNLKAKMIIFIFLQFAVFFVSVFICPKDQTRFSIIFGILHVFLFRFFGYFVCYLRSQKYP